MAIDSIGAASTAGLAYQDTGKQMQRSSGISDLQSSGTEALAAGTVSGTGGTDKTSGSSQDSKNTDSDTQKNDAQRLKKAVDNANSKMKHARTGCEFSYNDKLNRVSITVYDKDTKEVIREIPPEESLNMLEKLWEIAGLLVDEKR